MNYSNSNLRLGKVNLGKVGVPVQQPNSNTPAPPRRRKRSRLIRLVSRHFASAAILVLGSTASGQFVISESAGLFSPSFRDTLTLDGGNTSWFGWQGNIDPAAFDNNGFDGATNNELIDNPTVLLGQGGRDGTLNQVGTVDVLADASNNIFAGDATNSAVEAHLTLQITTNGIIGTGFTTIILQGNGSVTGTGLSLFPVLGPINGISPRVANGINSAGRMQWWAKYELSGNADSYVVDILLPGGADVNPASVRQLVADTHWSNSTYAPDSALVPEPGSAALLGVVGAFTLALRRRSLPT